jgi:hypothetical protein
MQNAKCQLLWNDEMQNAKIFMGWMRDFWLFGFFGPLEAKMENGYLFAKNFAWCLVSFYKMMGQNPKIFG